MERSFIDGTSKFQPTKPGYYVITSVLTTCAIVKRALGRAYVRKNCMNVITPTIVYMNGSTDFLQVVEYYDKCYCHC